MVENDRQRTHHISFGGFFSVFVARKAVWLAFQLVLNLVGMVENDKQRTLTFSRAFSPGKAWVQLHLRLVTSIPRDHRFETEHSRDRKLFQWETTTT